MKFKFVADLQAHLKETKGADVEVNPEVCPGNMEGDLTVNWFRFAKLWLWRFLNFVPVPSYETFPTQIAFFIFQKFGNNLCYSI